MKHCATKSLNVVIAVLIGMFVVISWLCCFEIHSVYMIDYQFNIAGESYVDSEHTNSGILMTILCIMQIVCLFKEKNRLKSLGTITSIVCMIITILYAPISNLIIKVTAMMGGITYQECRITTFGYVACVLSIAIATLHAISFIRANKNMKGGCEYAINIDSDRA